jgi:hypothetical protein
MTDILGGAPEADPDASYAPSRPGLLSEPMTLAFLAFSLAFLTVLGAQVFRGISYTIAFAPKALNDLSNGDSPKASTSYLVAAAFLTAAFSLIPLALGVRGLKRTVDDDPAWVAALLRAAVALAALSLLLRLITAVMLATTVQDGTAGLFSYIGFT